MFETIGRLFIVGALGVLGACGAGAGLAESGTQSPPEPQNNIEVTSPASQLKVRATIAAGTLGDTCGQSSFCQRSNVQLAFNAGEGSKNAVIELVSVTLIDAKTSAVLATLAATTPSVWNGNGYVPWNQQMPPNGDLKASYDLASPDWNTIEGSSANSRTTSYGRDFKLHVRLRIDGVEVLLESTNLNRQPQAVT